MADKKVKTKKYVVTSPGVMLGKVGDKDRRLAKVGEQIDLPEGALKNKVRPADSGATSKEAKSDDKAAAKEAKRADKAEADLKAANEKIAELEKAASETAGLPGAGSGEK